MTRMTLFVILNLRIFMKFGQSWENIAKYQICGYNSQIGQVGYPWKAIKKAQRRWLQVNRSPQLHAKNPWGAIVKFCCFHCPSFTMLQTWPLWRNNWNMFEFTLFFFWAPVSHNVNPLVLPSQLGFPDNVLPHAPFRHKERHICLFTFKIRPLVTVPWFTSFFRGWSLWVENCRKRELFQGKTSKQGATSFATDRHFLSIWRAMDIRMKGI